MAQWYTSRVLKGVQAIEKVCVVTSQNMINRWSKTLFLVLSLTFVGGCASMSYYSQAVSGHLKLMAARQSIDELLAGDDIDQELRTQLETLVRARRFAVEALYLPDNDSYSTYVETGRDAVTWNVVATQEFSMQPETWCFPIAGCVSYRGYYAKSDAEHYAEALIQQNFDVTIGGASAYSTLGWFADPILDTMLRGGELRYVGTLFHELAHQLLYVKDDSDFNEAFASFVEQEGTRQWLAQQGQADRIARYDLSLQRRGDFIQLLRNTRTELIEAYSDPAPDAELRARKQAIFKQMRENYELLKVEWQGYAGYDGWFRRDLNNARLVAVSTYRRYVPAFAEIFNESNQDFQAFYKRAEELSRLPFAERRSILNEYLQY